MKIIVIGATGTIGRPVAELLETRHEVVRVTRSSGEYRVDISSPDSIAALYEAVAPFDAVVCTAGAARFGPLPDLSPDDFHFSLENKLMGQVNLVQYGLAHMNDGGSFTLTSGILSTEPMNGSAAISMVNAGLEGYARAAALDLPRGIRINVVSPPWVSETLVRMGRDGSQGMPADEVARAYVASVEGQETGKVIDARKY